MFYYVPARLCDKYSRFKIKCVEGYKNGSSSVSHIIAPFTLNSYLTIYISLGINLCVYFNIEYKCMIPLTLRVEIQPC